MVRLVLLRLLESFFRHSWLYVLPPMVLLSIGFVYVLVQPPKYTTSGKIYVEGDSLLASLTASQLDGAWWRTPAQITTGELRELLATEAFVRSAIQRTKLETEMTKGSQAVEQALEEYRTSIWLLELGESLIEIGASNEDPELSQQLVTATMDAYVQWKINADYQESVAAQGFFANLIKPYQEELQRARDELTFYLEEYPEPVRGERPVEEQMEIARLQSAVQRAEERVTSALNNEESARLALVQSESVTRQTYVLIDTAEVPRESNQSRREQAISIFLFTAVGMFLSVVGIVASALLDRTLRFPIDVRHILHLPVLATMPLTGGSDRREGQVKRTRSGTVKPTQVDELRMAPDATSIASTGIARE